MINTSPYDRHGDDSNSYSVAEEIRTQEDTIQDLAKDYIGDLEGFMNELSVVNLSDEEKAHYINQNYSSIDMARVVYPLFIKCYENVKETQRLRDLINETWNKSQGLK